MPVHGAEQESRSAHGHAVNKIKTMMQRTANKNAAGLLRIYKTFDQSIIGTQEKDDARLILRRKLNGTTTKCRARTALSPWPWG